MRQKYFPAFSACHEVISAEQKIITGPPTHSVGASIVLLVGVCRRLSLSSVVVCNTRICNLTHQGQHAARSSVTSR